jgi:DNA-binding NtrC family response regulator
MQECGGRGFLPGFVDGLAVANRLPSGAPSLVVFSADDAVVRMAADAVPPSWSVNHYRDPNDARSILSKPGTRLAVIDDEAILDSTLGLLVERIHRHAPQAFVLYVASSHSVEIERRARALGVQYYTAKPLDYDRTVRVLRSFARAGK